MLAGEIFSHSIHSTLDTSLRKMDLSILHQNWEIRNTAYGILNISGEATFQCVIIDANNYKQILLSPGNYIDPSTVPGVNYI